MSESNGQNNESDRVRANKLGLPGAASLQFRAIMRMLPSVLGELEYRTNLSKAEPAILGIFEWCLLWYVEQCGTVPGTHRQRTNACASRIQFTVNGMSWAEPASRDLLLSVSLSIRAFGLGELPPTDLHPVKARLASASFNIGLGRDVVSLNAGEKDEFFLKSSDEKDGYRRLLDSPIWLEKKGPGILVERWKRFKRGREHDNSVWSFWREWYQGFLDGKPMDWELQRRVALIDDAIWEAGPEAVAREIERVRALFDLEQEVARLKEAMQATVVATHAPQIGDNGGPPLEEEAAKAIKTEMILVWGQIEDLEAEIAKPDPSPSRLKQIAKALADISVRIAKYCGAKVDLAITEGVKEVAKFGAKAGITYYTAATAAQNEGIQSVVKAIWAFVKTLPGG